MADATADLRNSMSWCFVGNPFESATEDGGFPGGMCFDWSWRRAW